jgi:hypothetical protein
LARKLNPFKDCEFFALKKKIRPRRRNKKTLYFFYIIMVSIFLFFNTYIYPVFEDDKFALILLSRILFIISMILTAFLSVLDPGYVQ